MEIQSEPTTPRPNEPFGQVTSLFPQMLHETEHENAVLGHDPDADDGAQERDDVQRRPGRPESEDRPEHPEHDVIVPRDILTF